MKKFLNRISNQLFVPVFIILVTGCRTEPAQEAPKPVPVSAVTYIDLSGKFLDEQNNFGLDFNKDGRNDLLLIVQNIAYENNTKTRKEFQVYSTGTSRIAINTTNDSWPLLFKGQKVVIHNFAGFEWLAGNKLVLMKKVVASQLTYWDSNFTDGEHRYLPFHLYQAGKYHTGWLELSTDTAHEKVLLHRAAVAVDAETEINTDE